MNVSSVGAAQSLDYLSLLSTRSRTSASGSSSADSTADTLSLSLQALMMSSQAQGTNPFQTDFDNLGSLIQSGDLEGAKKAYAAMQEKLQAHGSDGGRNDAMSESFAAIGKALDSGDTSAAQSAWSAMQTQLQSMGGPGGGTGGNPFEQDMTQLGTLLDAGDVEGAKSLYQTMQSRMKSHQPPPQGGQSGSSSGGTGAASGLSAIGEALDSDDLSAAQDAWTALMQELQQRGSAHV
jgi:hypothetical protein